MFKRFKKQFPFIRLNPPQVLSIGFIVIIFLGSVLLSLPIASADGTGQPYLDALFMSASATCVTGLSVINTGEFYSFFGEIVLLLLVQIGGLGFMTMATLIALVFRRKITFRERLILQEAMNHNSTEGIVRLIRKVLYYSLIIELTGAILLAIRWSFELPFKTALYFGVFHSISIFNNAGFDLFSSLKDRPGSLMHYVDDPFVNIISILLIVLGGIGFIVISDLLTYRFNKKLSLHSKVVLSVSGILIAVGCLVIFVFEFTNTQSLQPLSPTGKILSSLFQSVSSRSAGLNTLDIGSLRQGTQFFIIIMMFIGASPGSSGGGIKVTTFAILVGAMIAMVRGKEDIVMFQRRIAGDRIYKAITFTMISFLIIVVFTMVLSTTENFSFLGILFEVTSAYATAGMSLGLTPQLTSFGKMLIILLMFIGRLGPVTLAFSLTITPEKDHYRYPEGKITIG
ncbi:TrkH family potassium uptake protein [Paenibacillus allorhizosphaerae]|uniref:Ktr system potassium uptake protein B n=1 Tax=Paenibacillus allorhizosphaerae TaxID=2849866 RepID=A0ABN7TUX2_9BACL|nr:TrkH family potassium uptake protein [Paenibacillus allorhizosphaerae]CAG7656539.1 Ktr system potassium uptake protein B [Paenibacillus allorhizosphaerae]